VKFRVRLTAILFAVLSALYWRWVPEFWNAALSTYDGTLPFVFLQYSVPLAIYALICLYVFHRLTRRLARHFMESDRSL